MVLEQHFQSCNSNQSTVVWKGVLFWPKNNMNLRRFRYVIKYYILYMSPIHRQPTTARQWCSWRQVTCSFSRISTRSTASSCRVSTQGDSLYDVGHLPTDQPVWKTWRLLGWRLLCDLTCCEKMFAVFLFPSFQSSYRSYTMNISVTTEDT